MTFIKKDENLEAVYKLLVEIVNEKLYRNKLFGDPNLFFEESEEEWDYEESEDEYDVEEQSRVQQ